MKKIILLILLFPILGTAQVEWLKTPEINFNMNPEMIGYATAIDPSGNVYLAGYKDHPFIYNDIMGTVYFNKYDANGSLLFSKTFEGHVSVYNITTDSAGNTLMTINYVESVTIGNLAFLTAMQGEHPMLLKFDPLGNLLWYYQPQIEEWPASFSKAITVDADDNIYLGYSDYLHSFITKFSPSGNILLTISQEYVRLVSSISVDNEGNIYSAGSCSDLNSKYGGVPQPTSFGYSIYIAKYSPTGDFQWVNYVEDITCPTPEVKAKTPDAIYFSSHLFGAFTFGETVMQGPDMGTDIFIAKLNASGDYQWIREIPGAGSASPGNRNFLNADNQGNVYFAGRTRRDTQWSDTISTSVAGFSHDALLLKYNSNGELLFAHTVGGGSEDRYDAIAIGASGDLYVSGMANGPATFGTISHDAPQFTSYPFLAKINETMLGKNNLAGSKIEIYPNPAGDYFHINGNYRKMKGTIFNALGQYIKVFETTPNAPIDISSLAKGVYLVKLDGESLKLIKS